MSENLLVTGGAGFIGSNLVERLVQLGHHVVVLDDLSAGRLENLDPVMDRIKFNVGTVADLGTIETLLECYDIKTIYHMATPCLVKGLEDPKLMHTITDMGTFNVCLGAMNHGAKIIYISTSEIYGNLMNFPIDEVAPVAPVSIYGLTKLIGEEYVSFFNRIFHVPAVIIRPFNTYGPKHREDRYACVITNFIKQALEGEDPVIHGDGQQSRDFSYVDDIVEGIIKLGKLVDGEIINIGSGKDINMLDLAKIVWKLFGSDIEPRLSYSEVRPNDVRKLQADNSLARTYGFRPENSLEAGLEKYINWMKEKESRK